MNFITKIVFSAKVYLQAVAEALNINPSKEDIDTVIYSTDATIPALKVDAGLKCVSVNTATAVEKLTVAGSFSAAKKSYFSKDYSVTPPTEEIIDLREGINTLTAGFAYRVELVTRNTGENTGAVYIITQDTNAPAFTARRVSAKAITNYSPLLRVDGTSLKISHSSTGVVKTIRATVLAVDVENVTICAPHIFGLESILTCLADKLGIGTETPVSSLEIQDGLTTAGSVLTLSTKEPSIVAGNVLGKLAFRAPLEAAGGDAVLNGAAIEAVAEDTFSATVNKTSLAFKTGASETATTKMTLDSAGVLTVTGKVTAAASILTYGLQLEKNIILATLTKVDGGTPAPTTAITVPNTFEGNPAFSGKLTLLMLGNVGSMAWRQDRYEVTWLDNYITFTKITDPTQTADVALVFTKSGATITVSMTSAASPGNTVTAAVRGQFTELSNFNLSS